MIKTWADYLKTDAVQVWVPRGYIITHPLPSPGHLCLSQTCDGFYSVENHGNVLTNMQFFFQSPLWSWPSSTVVTSTPPSIYVHPLEVWGKHGTKVSCLRLSSSINEGQIQDQNLGGLILKCVHFTGNAFLTLIVRGVNSLESRWCVGRNKTLALEGAGFWSFCFYLKAVSPGAIYLPSVFLSFFIFSVKQRILQRVALRLKWASMCSLGAQIHSLWVLGAQEAEEGEWEPQHGVVSSIKGEAGKEVTNWVLPPSPPQCTRAYRPDFKGIHAISLTPKGYPKEHWERPQLFSYHELVNKRSYEKGKTEVTETGTPARLWQKVVGWWDGS